MPLKHWACATLILLAAAVVRGEDEYTVAPLAESAPSEGFSEAIRGTLRTEGLLIKQGDRGWCRLWLTKSWPATAGFTATQTVLYPFSVGELFGAVEYLSAGEDFRGQEIAAGYYTLRYAQQPVDGNHVGTSETIDFLLLLPAEGDADTAAKTTEQLIESSKEAAQGNHPAMLCLQRLESAEPQGPELQHDTDRELWSLLFTGEAAEGDKLSPLPVKLVVVGKAAE